MLSPLADIVSIVVCYLLLFLLQKEVVHTEEHSLPYRVTGFLCAWGLCFLLFDWFLNIVLVCIRMFTGGGMLLMILTFQLLITGGGIRAYPNPLPGLDFDDVKDFFHDSLFFNNYLRRRDSELKEELDRFVVQNIHRETSNTPVEDIFPQERPPKEKRFEDSSSEFLEREKERAAAGKIGRSTELLRKGETVNMSDDFRIKLMNNPHHPYLPKLDEFVVDPARKTLTMRLPLPDTLRIDIASEKEINDLIGDLYLMLLVLLSEKWLLPYTPFFQNMVVRVQRSVWGELGNVTLHDLLTISLSIRDLRRYEGQIMPADSVKQIAAIEYHFRKSRERDDRKVNE